MKKICHIRGNTNYWETFDVINHWKKHQSFPIYKQFSEYWDSLLNIPHMRFRKLIRDLVINQIKRVNCFDEILENNESCYEYFNNNSHEVILFQQDDDDIFIKPISSKLSPGVCVFNYSYVDFNRRIRSKEYHISKKHYDHRSNLTGVSIQSNHAVLNNVDNIIDFKKYKVWEMDHTMCDKICNQYYGNCIDDVITTQFYHLHSFSTWKVYAKNNNILTEEMFLSIIRGYIHRFNEYKDINIPLITDFKKLYNKLL